MSIPINDIRCMFDFMLNFHERVVKYFIYHFIISLSLLFLLFMMDWSRSKIYKPYSGYLVSRLLQMSAVFNWLMMRVTHVDQQSKPYMLDSLWLMDFIQMHWSIKIQIQIYW
ncbi:hypothetical protein LINPERHAP2_LOCUS20728 [Linum perenne]